jgi:multidrug efflux system membrane fusion protein
MVEPLRNEMTDPNQTVAARPDLAAGAGPGKKGGAARWIVPLVVVLVAAAVAGRIWRQQHLPAAGGPGGRGARGGGGMAVPVVTGLVIQTNLPIYLDGLGTVQAFNTVTVHVRVDGQLEKVNFTEGQFVHAGDVLAEIDPAPYQAALDQAAAKKGQDQAQLNLQRVELKREASLLAAKIDSQDAYDQVAAQVKTLEAGVTADQAAMDAAQVQLNYTKITSPLDGLTGVRLVDQGNIVHASDAGGVVVITQMRPISVLFTLPEQSLGPIQKHQGGAGLEVLATASDNITVLDRGKLTVIDNQIDPTTSTIRIKATFPNDHLQLWPGQFVNTRLVLLTRTNAVVVPEAVVQRGPKGAFVFVVNDDDTVEVRPVKVSQMQDGLAMIDDGLDAGEEVVVDGQYKLQDGSRIRLAGAGAPGKGAAPSGAKSQ